MTILQILQETAASNPQLAADLKKLRKDYTAQLRQLAEKYEVELPAEKLSEEDLDGASGGLW